MPLITELKLNYERVENEEGWAGDDELGDILSAKGVKYSGMREWRGAS